MFKVEYQGATISCSTEAELRTVIKVIGEQNPFHVFSPGKPVNTWTTQSFFQFMENLKDTQKSILVKLLESSQSDADLRKAAGVTSNQQLAGLLSSISKQAGAVGIPAREVFKIENESRGGTTTKTYKVASEFAEIARDCNWDGD